MFAIHDITACHRTHKMSNTSKKSKSKTHKLGQTDTHTDAQKSLASLWSLAANNVKLSPPLCFPQSFVFARLWRQRRLLTSCPPLIVWLPAPIELTMTICAEVASEVELSGFERLTGSRWREKFWCEPDGTVNGTSPERRRCGRSTGRF